MLATALDKATAKFLENNKSPSRKVNELDNRGSHFYLAMYWARALADQKEDAELAALFNKLADRLEAAEETIIGELNGVQDQQMGLDGYYLPDPDNVKKAMRPSPTFDEALQSLRQSM